MPAVSYIVVGKDRNGEEWTSAGTTFNAPNGPLTAVIDHVMQQTLVGGLQAQDCGGPHRIITLIIHRS